MRRKVYTTLAPIAAGAEITNVPNYGDTHRLLALRAEFVTSASVANRFPHLQLVDRNGVVYFETAAGTAQAAGATDFYSWVGGNAAQSQGTVISDNVYSLPLPDFWVPPQFTWQTKTTNLQTTDQWSNMALIYEVGNEWEHLEALAELESQIAGLQ